MADNEQEHPLQAQHVRQDNQHHELPRNARTIGLSKLELAFDAGLLVIACTFLWLDFYALSIDGEQAPVGGGRIMDATKVAISTFPIVYAAICGRFLLSIALYRTQKGWLLKYIELLSTARTIFRAIEGVVMLANYNLVGLLVVLCWLPSPFGGQAHGRLLRLVQRSVRSAGTTSYLGPDFLSYSPLVGSNKALQSLTLVSVLYLSSLVAPTAVQNGPQDPWDNVKIPHVKSLTEPLTMSGSFVDAKPLDGRTYWSPWGVPVSNLTDGLESLFFLESLQLDVRCSSLQRTTLSDFSSITTEPLIPAEVGFQRSKLQNSGVATGFLHATQSSVNSFHANTSSAIDIYYGSRAPTLESDSPGSIAISLAECNISVLRLNSSVTCHGKKCLVNRVQLLPTNLTTDQGNVLTTLLTDGMFVGEGLSMDESQSSLTDHWIFDPHSVVNMDDNTTFVELFGIPIGNFEDRLRLALNSFWYSATSQVFTSGSGSELFADPKEIGSWVNTTTTLTEQIGDHYACNRWWLTAALSVTLFMVAMSLAKVMLTFMTSVPDWFGYVSSLTIINPDFEHQWTTRELNTAMDGFEIAKSLGDLKVVMTDHSPHEPVGEIAFTHGLQKPSPVPKGRMLI